MNFRKTCGLVLFGGALFLCGLILGFNEGKHFGATVVSVNTGFVAVNLLSTMKENPDAPDVGNQLEFDVEAGLIAGEALRLNPNWARLGFLVSSTDPDRLDTYLETIRAYRAANNFDFSNACAEAGCAPTN